MKKWLVLAAVPPVVGVVMPLALLVAGAGTLEGSDGSITCSAPAAGRFTSEQVSIAATARQVAARRKLPDRAVVVILATGLQESGIRNLSYGDRDSVGWLQQRASWGTVAQRMDPAYAAGKFFDALVKIQGWEALPVTVAAQRVQISAFPDAYAKWQAAAASLLALVGGVDCSPANVGGGPVPANFDKMGNPRTVEQAIAWYLRQAPNGAPGERVLGMCERYSATLAYGYGGGYASAAAHWAAAGTRVPGYSAPPRGALVFWASGGNYGHVALSLGNGQVISTDFDGTRYHAGRIGVGPITAIDGWGKRLGWRPPDTGKRL